MFKPLRPILGQPEDIQRRLEERARRRSTKFQDIPWAPVRPGESHDMIQELMSHYGEAVEGLLTLAFDQEIEGDELKYRLLELAAKLEEEQAENARECQLGRRL